MDKEHKHYEKQKPLTLTEMRDSANKRVSNISKEFDRGFDFLSNYQKSVTIFGSTQIKPGDPYYTKTVEIAGRIVTELHYSIITGGGPGIMEAGNKGAYEAGGNSLGLTIELPHGQVTNRYLTDTVSFHYFFSRKVCMAFSAEAYLFFPGGFGTLDEFCEILTLVQTNKIAKVPIILVGVEFWTPLIEFFKNTLRARDMIDESDLELFTLTDDNDKILNLIKKTPVEIGVTYKGTYVDVNYVKSEPKSNIERTLSRFMRPH